jgi:toxin secretion/phage lysis holin
MNKTGIYAVQGAISTVIAAISAKLGILFYVLSIFAFVMVIDFISGMAASKKESIENPEDLTKGWSSRRGMLGIFKKFGYILVVLVAIVVDYIIFKIAATLNINMPTTTFFGLLVTVWFILNELLSIIENAGRMGAEGIPDFLIDAIVVLKGKVEKKGAEENENKQ